MSKSERKPVLLVLSQVYPPDPASVGQHMADAAEEMVRRGWRVKVLTSARGYNDSSIRYDSHEDRNGVEVRRLPLSSFGKRHFLLRALAAILFMLQTIVRGLFAGKSDALLVSTSPPMCIVAALIIRFFRRSSVKFWVMDINPEQLIALGVIKPGSISARLMDFFNRRILKRSDDVVVLDRFMGDTMMKKLDVKDKIHTMPPWPHEDHLDTIPHEDNPFRKEHGLEGKFVFMYSGNHGIALPLETFLKSAVTYKDDSRIMFLFIGGGVRKQEVEETISEHGLTNMVSLPYQPMETLRYSLSSADVHLVSVGDLMVGVIHPCKIYGAMAVGRPILLLGPDPCHVSDVVHANKVGWHISHGDVGRATEVIREIADTPQATIQQMGERAQQVVREKLSKEHLCGMFCDVLEGKA